MPSSRSSTVGTRHAHFGVVAAVVNHKSVTPALAALLVRSTAPAAVIGERCTSMPVSAGPWMRTSGRVLVDSRASSSAW